MKKIVIFCCICVFLVCEDLKSDVSDMLAELEISLKMLAENYL